MRRLKRRVFIPIALLLAVGIGVLVCWRGAERGIIAYRIYRAGIFTSPTSPADPSWDARWHAARFYWDFAALRIAREKRLKQINPELRPLIRELDRHLAAGENMQYSMHIYREIRWRINFTSDVQTTRARIDDLRHSLNEPGLQAQAAQQQPDDGSWGMGIDPNVWYLRFYYTVEDGLTRESQPKYPLRILDRINSPEKLDAQLDSALYDDSYIRVTSSAKNSTRPLQQSCGCSTDISKPVTHAVLTLTSGMRSMVEQNPNLRLGAGDNGWWTAMGASGKWTIPGSHSM